ncbi:cysteine-rich RLK (RECEPTOR-like protein kinase) 8, partial [Striga hermonthica]
KVNGNAVVFVALYVDDILLTGNDVGMLQSTRTWLSKQFSMKDLGEASFILGIKIYRERFKRMIGLSQSTYINKVLKRFSMEESKRGYIPMSHGVSLSKTMSPNTPEEREWMSHIPYASAIGSIMYAMLCIRPDVAHVLSVTSRYQSNSGEEHWKAVKMILKYLRKTKDIFMVYENRELNLEGFTDSGFQSDKDDFNSMSGYLFTLNGAAVSWKSSKQETISDSTTEAEYIAASDAAKEVVWIRNFIQGLGVVPSVVDPIMIYCDNNGAIAQAKEPRSHQRSKHIMRRYHLIREIIGRGDVVMERVDSAENIADPLTKPLSQKRRDRCPPPSTCSSPQPVRVQQSFVRSRPSLFVLPVAVQHPREARRPSPAIAVAPSHLRSNPLSCKSPRERYKAENPLIFMCVY